MVVRIFTAFQFRDAAIVQRRDVAHPDLGDSITGGGFWGLQSVPRYLALCQHCRPSSHLVGDPCCFSTDSLGA